MAFHGITPGVFRQESKRLSSATQCRVSRETDHEQATRQIGAATLQRTTVGQTDLEISRVVFGSMGHGAASEQDRVRALHAAIDAGITSIDTAPLYGFGEVESMLGRALRERRDQVELLGKVGLRWDDRHGDVLFEFRDETGARRIVRRDCRPEAIRKDVETSLTRLQTDHLDLCQIHHPDARVSIEESLGMLEALIREGKIRHIGVSNFTRPQIERAIAGLRDHPLASDQLEYNLIKRSPEHEIVPLARRHGFGLLAYSPLDAGSLGGRLLAAEVGDGRRDRASFRPANAKAINAALHECLAPVAARHDASLAQIALAWLLAQEQVSGVIVGARTPEQAEANAHASAVPLSSDEILAIGQRFADVRIDSAAGLGFRTRVRHFARRLRRGARRVLVRD